MLLCELIGDKHAGVGEDGTDAARGETSPEAGLPSLVFVDELSTVNHPPIGHVSMILREGIGVSCDLEFCLDNILGIGDEPGEKAANTSSYEGVPRHKF
jgi:hypothetical protein